jgi:uncharacterized protein (DUF885 family)
MASVASPTETRAHRADGLPEPSGPFEAAVVELLVDLFGAYPTWGTQVGYHTVDGRWSDLTAEGRGARLAMLRRHHEAIEALPGDVVGAEERIDRGIVLDEIDRALFGEESLVETAWDPLSVVLMLGGGLFGILAREYAPWSQRGAALVARLDGIPTLTRDAIDGLTGLPDRPVSLLHLETALKQVAGVDELIVAAVSEAGSRAEAGEASELVEPMRAAAAAATEAVARFRAHLDEVVRGRAEGEGRLGGELFSQKLRFTLGSEVMPDELRRQAWLDHAAVRAEMLRIAREIWPAWITDEPLPEVEPGDVEGEGRLVRRVLDAIAQVHPQPDGLIAFCEEEVARIERFCREQDVISLPDEPMAITWTPVFMRAYGRAFLDAPGPLDRGQRSHFWITPPDESNGPEAVESYLREENDRALRLLCIHEGIPGHYLQLAASNRSPSLVRTVFTDGMFAEGWAVYVTQVMMDLGYAADDPAVLLNHWKMYLRAVTNAILDVETHTGEMTREEAMDLMVVRAFQEEDEATGKWLRARLTATQLSTYYVGSQAMWDIELESRRRAAVAAGAGEDAVPPQRIAGGIGDTPGFAQRPYLESVIAHGTPPIPWLRRILLDPAA